jgi:FkbM family methyltransferase
MIRKIYYLTGILFNISFATAAYAQAGIPYNLIEGKPDIYIHPDAETLGPTWIHGQIREKHLIQKFYNLLPTNEPFVAFDLGAQTGSFTLMAKYFPLSTWYAFEPIQEAADILRQNLILNAITNVFVHQVAVTDFSGTATLKMPDRASWGLCTIGPRALRFTPKTTREIPCIDLDSFVEENQIARVHFMKLDTEGSELAILRGARKMIQRDHPIMIMEHNETNMEQCNIRKKDLEDFLIEMGYEWKLISHEDILCTQKVSF